MRRLVPTRLLAWPAATALILGGLAVATAPSATAFIHGSNLTLQVSTGSTVNTQTPVVVTHVTSQNPVGGTVTVVVTDSGGTQVSTCSEHTADDTDATACQPSTNLPNGTYTVTTTMVPDDTSIAPVTSTTTYTVANPTSISFTSFPVAPLLGQSNQFTVVVPNGVPGSPVTLTTQQFDSCTATLDNTLYASCPLSFDIAGPSTVTATYNPATTTGVATNAFSTATQVVYPQTPSTYNSLIVSPSSSTIALGGSVTFGTLTESEGSIAYQVDPTTTQYAILPDGTCSPGSAAVTCTPASAGPHVVTFTDPNSTCGDFNCTYSYHAFGAATVLANGPATQLAVGVTGGATSDARPAAESGASRPTAGAGVHAASVRPAAAPADAGGPPATVVASSGTYLPNQPITVAASSADSAGDALAPASSAVISIEPDGRCLDLTCYAASAGPHVISMKQGGLVGDLLVSVAAPQDAPGSGGAPAQYATTSHVSLGAPPQVGSPVFFQDDTVVSDSPNAGYLGFGDVTFLLDGQPIDGSNGGNNAGCGQTPPLNTYANGHACYTTITTPGWHAITALYDGGENDDASQQYLDSADTMFVFFAGDTDHLQFDTADTTVPYGGAYTYTVDSVDANGAFIADVSHQVTLSFVGGGGYCPGMTCVPNGTGTFQIRATLSDGSGHVYSGTTTLVESPPVVARISLTPGSTEQVSGRSATYSVEGFDANGDDLGKVTSRATLSISPNGSCSANRCTATTAGPHTVTASVGSVTASSKLEIVHGSLDHLVLTLGKLGVNAGQSESIKVTGYDQSGNPWHVTPTATQVAISPAGTCTTTACASTVAGVQTVTVTIGGVTASGTFQVRPGALAAISVNPQSSQLTSGASQVYAVSAVDSYGNAVSAAGTVAKVLLSNGSAAPYAVSHCIGLTCKAFKSGSYTVVFVLKTFSTQATLVVTARQ